MADALLSPAVGGALWGAAGSTTALAARALRREGDDRKVPLTGATAAFVFAAQMVNFAIPGTGSSGHLGGGLLLAALLGPHAAFLAMASILALQALFFADGGLLALGANLWNLGFFPAYVAYPLIFRPLAGRSPSPGRLAVATTAAAVLGLQLGALGVVVETVLSGVAALPWRAFLLAMLPIHLAIGLVEGVVTFGVLSFISRARPDVLAFAGPDPGDGAPRRSRLRPVLVGLLATALLTGWVLSRFASELPDGLEWSLERASGTARALAGPILPAAAPVKTPVAAAGGLAAFGLVALVACLVGLKREGREGHEGRRGDEVHEVRPDRG